MLFQCAISTDVYNAIQWASGRYGWGLLIEFVETLETSPEQYIVKMSDADYHNWSDSCLDDYGYPCADNPVLHVIKRIHRFFE